MTFDTDSFVIPLSYNMSAAKSGAKETVKPKAKVSHLHLIMAKLSERHIGSETGVYTSRCQGRGLANTRTNAKNRL